MSGPDWNNAAELANSMSTVTEESLTDESSVVENPSIPLPISLNEVDSEKKIVTPQLSPKHSISHKRSSSVTLGVPSADSPLFSSMDGSLIVSYGPCKETKAIIHQRTQSAHKGLNGFGSGTLSPSVIGVQSPENRRHTHTASFENISSLVFETTVTDENEVSECGNGGSEQQDCVTQLVIVFDNNTEEKEDESDKMEDNEVIENITIGLMKQELNEFTFRVSCDYCRNGMIV